MSELVHTKEDLQRSGRVERPAMREFGAEKVASARSRSSNATREVSRCGSDTGHKALMPGVRVCSESQIDTDKGHKAL
eukprot:COSAG02_NODE_12897_length_1475_cov_1.417151_2_plen_78_part_00